MNSKISVMPHEKSYIKRAVVKEETDPAAIGMLTLLEKVFLVELYYQNGESISAALRSYRDFNIVDKAIFEQIKELAQGGPAMILKELL
ncbi:UNVERIFIED_CONTAM: hypothetical protein NCL1_33557 [Trichonephila clavipes]